ncbi:MAG: hypothetical protein ACTSYA_06400 [Candidatus Kariarchaeaceae archaeon]
MSDGDLSLAIFITELIILIIVIYKNHDHPQFVTISSLILILMSYQFLEYVICRTSSENIVRVAFLLITFLPPRSYQLATQLAKWPHKDYIIGYLLGIGCSLYFLVVPDGLTFLNCNLCYATYLIKIRWIYSAYYFGIILYAMIFLAVQIAKREKENNKKQLILLLSGFLLFIVPMIVLLLINFDYHFYVTSLLCKLAFLFVITLAILSFMETNE